LSLIETAFEHIQPGRRFSPLIYSVSEGSILKYADAVDDLNLFHRDRIEASSGPFGGIIAPPTLASLFVLKAYRTDWVPPRGGVQREQKFRFFAPIRPGDILTVQAEVTEKVKKNGSWSLTFASHSKNQKGEIVVWSESTSVWGSVKKKKDRNQCPNKDHFKDRTEAIIVDAISPIEKWKIGDSLPILTKKISREKISQYEEILGIGNPIHVDEEYARKTPFKGVIAHGLVSAAYISESMMKVFPWEWVHHGAMDIQFRHPLRPGDTVRTGGKLKREESTEKGVFLVFEVRCKNQAEETVAMGAATVQMSDSKSIQEIL
jgi:3-hydroxybutyryl-CoA dehydratase